MNEGGEEGGRERGRDPGGSGELVKNAAGEKVHSTQLPKRPPTPDYVAVAVAPPASA